MEKLSFEIKYLEINDLSIYKEELINLYISSFTFDDFPLQVSKDDAIAVVEKSLQLGSGIAFLTNGKIISLLLMYPLEFHKDFPTEQLNESRFSNALYIAEVMVAKEFRKRGIATLLIDETNRFAAKKNYKSIVLRVWDKNGAAISLYDKLGFKLLDIEIVEQHCNNLNQLVEKRKLYLMKKIKIVWI